MIKFNNLKYNSLMKKILLFLMLCLACFGVANAQTTQSVLSENFSSTSIATSYSATGWYAYNAGSGNNWTLSSGAAKYNYSSSSAANCYLVSAPFSVSADMIELSVSLAENTGGWAETFEVFFVKASDVTSAAAVATATQYSAIATATYNNSTAATVSGSITAAALAGQSVRVVVHCTSAADQYWLTVDDINVTETLAPQGPYIMLNSAAETVLTGFTKTLTATYGNVTGTPSITYTSSNTSVATVSGNGTTATVTGVSAGTATITATMTVNGTPYTATCAVTVEDPSYCTPNPSSVDGKGITSLTFGSGDYVVNNSNSNGLPSSSPFYGDYTSMVGGYEPGETATVTITYSTGSSTVYSYGTIIWVDWNKNYTFEDGEIVYTGTSVQGSNGTPQVLTATFSVPASQAAGDYCMRIAGADSYFDSYIGGTASANHDPCFSSTYAVCHDYTLRVVSSNPCGMPTNLQSSQVVTDSAHLSWDGTNDSYVLQYRTAAQDMNMSAWHQVGEDVVTSHEFTQYSFDLSDYAGQMGYIAIRHYAVSDMFILAIDDIAVTDANGTTVLSEGFDSGIPSAWDNIDYDGDGYVWGSTTSSLVNGSCAYSESYSNDTYSALTPDNWLVIPNVTLGGTLTLYALGLDSQGYHQENFGVFVATQSYAAVPAGEWSAEIPVATTSYNLTGLTANTAYEWQVKGVCNEYPDPSNWASSSFTTIPENFKTFITEGSWNVADNWFPAGVPAITDEVAIAAPATIPANVVALAKKATIETGGSITIEEGGQLKQGSATLKLTMEKSITGYGAGNENAKDHYYFIASPFGGRTQLLSNASNWSHVLHVKEGNYDLYGFDPTSESEWINYESSSSHILFTSTNDIEGLEDGNGYLFANEEDKVLEFTGTAVASNNVIRTIDYTYDSESTDEFNGLKLVGNPYTCNAYINYVDGEGALQEADLYVLNQDGDGFKLATSNELAPLTAAFLKVNASGKIQFSTEPIDASPALSSHAAPCLPDAHGETANQDITVCTVTLDTITIMVTGNTATLTYNGSEQSVTGYELSCEDELFDATLVTFTGTGEAKGTTVGTYPMGLDAAQFSYDNINIVAIFNIVSDGGLTIEKATMAVTVTGNTETKTYNGSEQSVTGYTLSSESDLFNATLVLYSGESDSTAAGTVVGTYPMNLTAADFSYDNSNINVSFNVTDGGLTINPINVTVTITAAVHGGRLHVQRRLHSLQNGCRYDEYESGGHPVHEHERQLRHGDVQRDGRLPDDQPCRNDRHR